MHLHFVTGRLAETALRAQVASLSERLGFHFSIDVLPITVAALMTPKWVAKHWTVPPDTTRVILPGYCSGDLAPLTSTTAAQVERGPRDLRQLPEFLGANDDRRRDYGGYDIQILAEINHAPRLARDELVAQARRLAEDGADLIDVGCEPGEPWRDVDDAVKSLKDAGLRVSIDSLNPAEIAPAVAAGAELVLSVNATNRDAAADWGCEVVVI
ncbi:MAG TPA: DUF6513 domain-containing protein, partial [Pirellulaceae bacterium]|nr:DUF6513 domain-containing protein [Pirellulaceae bacterium]